MLVSYKWLNEYLDLSKVTAKELADRNVINWYRSRSSNKTNGWDEKIVVGEVKECVHILILTIYLFAK